MKNTLIRVVALLVVGVPAAQAQFSSTVTAVSDYDFRGVSLSAKDPALQASVDYAFSNGFAIGAWASNVDFGDDASYELDLYANYTGKINDTFSWTAGIVHYQWDSTVVGDYPEAFVGFSAGAFSFKQWYADDYGDLGVNAWYTEGNYTVSISDAVSLSFHAGYNYGDYWKDFGFGEMIDYSVGLGYTAGHFNLGAKFTGTDASGDQKVTGDVFNNEPRFFISVATTFPWGE